VRNASLLAAACAALLSVVPAAASPDGKPTQPPTSAPPPADAGSTYLFNDVHFHLTNYIQKGLTIRQYLAIMGNTVKRSALFGIPLQQTWSWSNSGDFAPTYYLHTDAPLYYYSFTDAVIATAYLSLPQKDRDRLDPMITGFNPADMYGVDHIRRVLETFPGVFSGIGEFSIHKEFVSDKVAGETATLLNPALDRILDFAGEAGLVVILHCDIDIPFAKTNAPPVYFEQMRALLARHPKTKIIWAHTGLGRVIRPTQVQATTTEDERPPTHLELIASILADPAMAHVYFDISWDEVAKYANSSPEVEKKVSQLFERYPDRFLFGTDNVAPPNIEADLKVFHMWDHIFGQLDPKTKALITFGNYERLFDEARSRVRAWERANVKPDGN
jgi:predicted TIM-barrel fold metal-dependent hydrolase